MSGRDPKDIDPGVMPESFDMWFSNPDPSHGFHTLDEYYPFTSPKCECGAVALGHPGHSTWCPMHEPPINK